MQHEKKNKAFNFHFRLKWEKCIIAASKVHVKLPSSAKMSRSPVGGKEVTESGEGAQQWCI